MNSRFEAGLRKKQIRKPAFFCAIKQAIQGNPLLHKEKDGGERT